MRKSVFRDLYDRIWRGDVQNIDFNDACGFVEQLGFVFERQNGTSHRIYKLYGDKDQINLQSRGGKAKAYQLRQVRKIMMKYRLEGEYDD